MAKVYTTENIRGREFIRVPEKVWEMAEKKSAEREAFYARFPDNGKHWPGTEHIMGAAAEYMARIMCREWGLEDWEWVAIFNPDFSKPVDKGGSPPWDLRIGTLPGYPQGAWRLDQPGHAPGMFSVRYPVEVKATGHSPLEKLVMRVKDIEYKPHPRLVFFATVFFSRISAGCRATHILPFHYATNSQVKRTSVTPKGEPLAPWKSCRVLPFPGFVRKRRIVTESTHLGPTLKLLTRDVLLRMEGRTG